MNKAVWVVLFLLSFSSLSNAGSASRQCERALEVDAEKIQSEIKSLSFVYHELESDYPLNQMPLEQNLRFLERLIYLNGLVKNTDQIYFYFSKWMNALSGSESNSGVLFARAQNIHFELDLINIRLVQQMNEEKNIVNVLHFTNSDAFHFVSGLLKLGRLATTMKAWKVDVVKLDLGEDLALLAVVENGLRLEFKSEKKSKTSFLRTFQNESFMIPVLKEKFKFSFLNKIRSLGIIKDISRFSSGEWLNTFRFVEAERLMNSLGYFLNPANRQDLAWEARPLYDAVSLRQARTAQKIFQALKIADELDLVILSQGVDVSGIPINKLDAVMPRAKWDAIRMFHKVFVSQTAYQHAEVDGMPVPGEIRELISYLEKKGYRYIDASAQWVLVLK